MPSSSSFVRTLNKKLWQPLLELSVWATETSVKDRLLGRRLERGLGWLTTTLKQARPRADAPAIAREWQRMMPSPRLVPIVAEAPDTVVAEIHAPCPYRGTGNTAGCFRMMEYDRRMLETIGGELVVTRSQAEPGVTTCQVVMRPRGADLSDLVPAHLRHPTPGQPPLPAVTPHEP